MAERTDEQIWLKAERQLVEFLDKPLMFKWRKNCHNMHSANVSFVSLAVHSTISYSVKRLWWMMNPFQFCGLITPTFQYRNPDIGWISWRIFRWVFYIIRMAAAVAVDESRGRRRHQVSVGLSSGILLGGRKVFLFTVFALAIAIHL